MPPKQSTSNLHHVTFHFYRSAVLLSLPSNTTIQSLKSALVPAIHPLASALPVPPPSTSIDIQLFETKPLAEGQERPAGDGEGEELVPVEEVGSIASAGWVRWKTLFVSFRGEDGQFAPPVYTIPDAENDEIPAEGEA